MEEIRQKRESRDFEDSIMNIVDIEDMEKLLRRVGYFYMALALKISSKEVNLHLRNKLSLKYLVDELDQEVKRIGPMRLEDGVKAQKFVLRLI
ncbi:MAG: hypothetical protein JJT76_15895 [Clostridiaceae bacterium]|nr:hypothetical protein [Clostridiaceae bacterium]